MVLVWDSGSCWAFLHASMAPYCLLSTDLSNILAVMKNCTPWTLSLILCFSCWTSSPYQDHLPGPQSLPHIFFLLLPSLSLPASSLFSYRMPILPTCFSMASIPPKVLGSNELLHHLHLRLNHSIACIFYFMT